MDGVNKFLGNYNNILYLLLYEKVELFQRDTLKKKGLKYEGNVLRNSFIRDISLGNFMKINEGCWLGCLGNESDEHRIDCTIYMTSSVRILHDLQ